MRPISFFRNFFAAIASFLCFAFPAIAQKAPATLFEQCRSSIQVGTTEALQRQPSVGRAEMEKRIRRDLEGSYLYEILALGDHAKQGQQSLMGRINHNLRAYGGSQTEVSTGSCAKVAASRDYLSGAYRSAPTTKSSPKQSDNKSVSSTPSGTARPVSPPPRTDGSAPGDSSGQGDTPRKKKTPREREQEKEEEREKKKKEADFPPADRNSCIRSEVKRGTHCADAKSLEVSIVNECRDALQAQICIQDSNNAWSCAAGPLAPDASHKRYICASTGAAVVAGCDASKVAGKQFRKTNHCGGLPTIAGNSLIKAGTVVAKDYPEPDQFKCFADKYFTRGTVCGNPNSVELVMDNRCGIPVQGRICLELRDGSFECGTKTIQPRESMTYHVCEGSGRFMTVACDAEKIRGGNFKNENCGGNPNRQPHSFVPQRSYPPPCPGYEESGGACRAKPGRGN